MNQTNLIAIIGGITVIGAVIATVVLEDEDSIVDVAPVSSTPPQVQPEAPKEPTVIDTPSTIVAKIQPTTPDPAIVNQPEIVEPAITPPSFDVVRITPDGDAVIAGRAIPGSSVYLYNNNVLIGFVLADDRGEWVFVPNKPFGAGPARLTLEMRFGKEKSLFAEHEVVMVIPEANKDIAGRVTLDQTSGALAMKVPTSGSGKKIILQNPSGPPSSELSVSMLDYDKEGRLSVSGYAPPDTEINLYLDNKFIGQTKTDSNSTWNLLPEKTIDPGIYKLRADQIDSQGKVEARVSLPFSQADPTEDLPDEPFIIVQPGNSLWRIARRSYGSGFSYTVIFDANKEQIADPDMIFPGQIFAMPPSTQVPLTN